MVEASCRVRTAVLGLTRLMNLPPDSLFVTDSVFENDSIVPRIPVISADQAEAYIQSDARIRNARSSIREKEYLHAAARSPMLPTLSIAAGYGTYFSSTADDPFRAQLDENRNPSLSFQLGIPIFNGGTVLMQERRQRLAVRASRLEAEKLQAQIRDEIHEAAIEAENCLQKYRSADETLRATNGLLSITEARYNLGAATALDYIIARNHHFKAMSDFLQAKWQYLFQLRMLDRYYR